MATDINPGLSAFCINKVVYDKLMTFWEEVGLLPIIFEGMIKLEYHNIQMNHHRQINLWPYWLPVDQDTKSLSKVRSFKVSENDNTFERNEDCATVVLKWTDFSIFLKIPIVTLWTYM